MATPALVLVECVCSTPEYLEHHIHPWFGKFWLNHKGYPRCSQGEFRNKFLHRLVWEKVAGERLPEGWQVHHQDHNKMHCCPHNLVASPPELHQSEGAIRCPYTGQFLTRAQYIKRYGSGYWEVPF